MRIFFRDEKYVAENVAILGDPVKDANLTGITRYYSFSIPQTSSLSLDPSLCTVTAGRSTLGFRECRNMYIHTSLIQVYMYT